MKEIIDNCITDLVSSFLYYDRKEDEDLPRGVIEKMIEDGEISIDYIVNKFKKDLENVNHITLNACKGMKKEYYSNH